MSFSQFHPTKMSALQRVLIVLILGILCLLIAGHSHVGGQAEPPGAAPATPQPYATFQLALAPTLSPADRERLLAQLRARYRGDVVPVGNLGARVAAPAGALSELRGLPGVAFADIAADSTTNRTMTPATITANGAITGVITDDGSGDPINNVGVCAYQQSPYIYNCGASDASGVYSISTPGGAYRLTFYPVDLHISEYYDNVSPNQWEDTTLVTVHDDTVTPNINAGLALGVYVGGQITAEAGGHPIQNAQITLSGGNYSVNGYSDSGGVYTTTPGLPPGDYQVFFYAFSYAREYYDNVYIASQATPLVVTTTHRLGINAAMTAAASISGTVTGDGPLQNVAVSAYYGDYDQFVTNETTNSEGHYQVYALAPVVHKLQFYDNNGQYLGEWYQDKSSWETADPIALTAGVTTTVDAQLNRGSAIAGTVVAEDGGAPLENIGVTTYYADTGNYAGYDATDASGEYRIGGLAPENYRIYFEDSLGRYLGEYYNNRADFYTADIVTLGSAMTQTINAELATGGRITGRLVDGTGGAGIANVNVNARCMNADRPGGYATSDAQGYYTMTNLYTGIYRVNFQPPPPYSGLYYENSQTSDLFTPVSVTTGITTPHIDAGLRRGYWITGVVSGPPALGGIAVNAYYSNRDYSVAQTSTANNGSYTLGPLTSGPYRVYFMPNSLYAGEWYNDAYRYRDAQIVNLTDHTVSDVNAHLETGGRITGTVTGTDGAPVAWADVRIYPAESEAMLLSAGADAQGRYATGLGLPDGTYDVEFNAPPGYVTQWYQHAAGRGNATPVTITAGSTVTGVNAVLTIYETGAITGAVTAADTAAPLSAWVYAYDDYGRQIRNTYANGGAYVLNKLPPGAYRILFDSPPAPYVGTYYHSQPAFSNAERITVTANMTVTHIDQALQRGGSITGTVSGPDGIPGVAVYAYRRSPTYFSKSTYTGLNGDYRLDGLDAGSYSVRFTPTAPYPRLWYANAFNESQAEPVTVTSGTTVPDINVTLAPLGYITGTITAADTGAAMPNAGIKVYGENGGPVGDTVYADADGHYRTSGLPDGHYYIYFDRNDWTFYRSEYYGHATNWDNAISVTVSAPAAVPNINVALGRGGSISGWIYDAKTGRLLSGVYVHLYSAPDYAYVAGAPPNRWGYYQITGVGDGTKKLYASRPDLYANQWYSREISFETALTVTITPPDDTSDINFYLEALKKVYLPLVLRTQS